jgi:hypothetical protein
VDNWTARFRVTFGCYPDIDEATSLDCTEPGGIRSQTDCSIRIEVICDLALLPSDMTETRPDVSRIIAGDYQKAAHIRHPLDSGGKSPWRRSQISWFTVRNENAKT